MYNSTRTTYAIEALEPRQLLTTFLVSNTADAGEGSLRQAILNANADANADNIHFAIASPGPWSIAPLTNLPTITAPVVLDATTQPGYAGKPVVEIKGPDLAWNSVGFHVWDGSDHSLIRGLVINGFQYGIITRGISVRVEGNFIGTDLSGTAAVGNGIGVLAMGRNAIIGGSVAAARNVISGNREGVGFSSGSGEGTVIRGNYIGTDHTGTTAVPNSTGVFIFGRSTIVGGTTENASDWNVIAGNSGSGIYAHWDQNARVQYNRIGINAEGRVLPNGGPAIELNAGTYTIAHNEIGFGASRGISVQGDARALIYENRVDRNGQLPTWAEIDLGNQGSNFNDAGDLDSGPNDLLNAPTVTSIEGTPSSPIVRGAYHGLANTSITIDLYLRGSGSSRAHLGRTTIATDANGNGSFAFNSDPTWIAAGGRIFATASIIDALGNGGVTSEMSEAGLPIGGGFISGFIGNDVNGDGVIDLATESNLVPDRTAYIDANENGALDAGERRFVTEVDGFWFNFLQPGRYVIRQVVPAGMRQTRPSSLDPAAQDAIVIDLINGQRARADFATTAAPLTADAGGPYTVSERATVGLNGSGHSDSGSIVKYEWDLDYDGSSFQVDATGARPAFSAAALDGPAATCTVALRVTDSAGATAMSAARVTVLNVAPTATFSINGPVTAGAPVTASFTKPVDVSADLQSLRHSFDFNNDGDFTDDGDVSGSTSATASFTFATAGTFNVRGRIADKDGGYTDYTTAVTVNPATPPPTTSVVLQAEDAVLSGGAAKASQHAGFMGTGYADYAGSGSAAQWAVTRTAAGAATLSVRYANGGTADRPLTVYVDNVAVGTLACAPTGSWTTWSTVSLAATLAAGTSTIRLVASTSAGGANVDALTITSGSDPVPPPPPPPPPPTDLASVTLQAEDALLSNGTGRSTQHAGFTGSGYADYAGNGSAAQFTVSRTAAGAATLQLRYANGGAGSRPLTVYVNGVAVGTIACAPTGGWATWASTSLEGVTLAAGDNAIRLVASTSAGGANVDTLTIINGGGSDPVTPPPVQPSVTVQAESATMVGVTRQTTNGGYTGTGYADFGGAGSYVQFTASRTTAGATTLKLRYANGGTTARPVSIAVNGAVVQSSVAMNGTGGWTNWQELTLTLDLLAGSNVIRLTSTTANGINLDAVTVG
ncbi:MAG TPA: carbohydrate-binding protein [Tepidisphaeraceae bacterium]|jgi:hypothetical protein|nr:carbohydrate-binding protein [Tepidisphaeraceae bacterium]